MADSVPIQDRVASWLSLLGSVNLFVALLNLVPLLPLDGGHITGALYEALRRGLARLRGKSDPGPVDTAKNAAGGLSGRWIPANRWGGADPGRHHQPHQAVLSGGASLGGALRPVLSHQDRSAISTTELRT